METTEKEELENKIKHLEKHLSKFQASNYPKLDVIDKPNSQIDYYWLLGMIICDAAIVRNSVIISIGDDEVDLLSEIQKHATVLDIYNDGCINVRTKHQERGVKGIYYDIRISGIRLQKL